MIRRLHIFYLLQKLAMVFLIRLPKPEPAVNLWTNPSWTVAIYNHSAICLTLLITGANFY